MLSFKNFMEDEVADEPVPPNVRPEDWANPTWRRFWKMQNPNYKAAPNLSQTTAPTAAQQQKPYSQQKVAPNLAQQSTAALQGYSDIRSIENALKSAVGQITGMPRTGTVDMIKPVDMPLAMAIDKAVRMGRGLYRPRPGESTLKIQPHSSEINAMEAGRGVHFFINKNGKTSYVINY